jgi:DNA polymerase III alpha subunit
MQLLGNEKETLGFYVTGHPLGEYRALIASRTHATTERLASLPDKSTVRLAAIVTAVKQISTKSGDRMARDLIQATRSRCLDLFDEPQLIADLYRLSIVERRFGFKLEAISDETGHADRGIALTIVLPTALEVSMMTPDDPDDCEAMGPIQLVA